MYVAIVYMYVLVYVCVCVYAVPRKSMHIKIHQELNLRYSLLHIYLKSTLMFL